MKSLVFSTAVALAIALFRVSEPKLLLLTSMVFVIPAMELISRLFYRAAVD